MGKTIQVSGFPRLIEAEVIKTLLEKYTGQGTVVSLEVKPTKRRQRAYVKVQFTNTTCAEIIIKLANCGLSYGGSRLRAWEHHGDMIQNPRTFTHEMDSINLHFGCQISPEKFLVLWRKGNIAVKFENGLWNMHFYLSHNSVEYRLQLAYENIWKIMLYKSRGQLTMSLLIQLSGAPRIYKKHGDSIYNYSKQTPDDQWVRTTDFTPSCIGQSSGLCLQLPQGMILPNFRDNFPFYKESEGQLFLENGVPLCENVALVPIVQPPGGLELPYSVLFKVCSLVQFGCLPGPKLDTDFFQLINPQKNDIRYIEHALEKLYYLKECCYDPVAWLTDQYRQYRAFNVLPKPPAISLDDGLVYVRRVQVTPTKVYFSGPEVNVSNRVLREFHNHIDNFLRVSFVDEEGDKIFSADLSPRVAAWGGSTETTMYERILSTLRDIIGIGNKAAGDENRRTKLYERILSTLRDGIRIGDKKFDFLAFSSSQLRENSLWMFAATTDLNADDIRQWMGDFSSIRNVAKYAARIGQSFGSSKETLSVREDETERIHDVVTERDGTKYVFSDGIGKISADFARQVARKCGVGDSFPSAFQIRYGGYKGVVAIDPTSKVKLSLRPSMLKYKSDNIKLDVLAWSKYQPCFLNRQIITLLSTLGVRDHVFEKKQREAVDQLDDMLVDPSKAEEALQMMSPGENTNILKEMLNCGYKPDSEPFLSMLLQNFRSSKLRDLRVKAKIFVPQAQRLMGCLDETGTLDYGQVFVQLSGGVLEQEVVVAKNPCLHPGDVRVLNAVDVPALHHMVDCVVFPQRGMRPHPNECSGSDLDGDIYFVCWDPDLIPPRQVPPMDYDSAPNTQLNHEVTIEEIEEYFTNYMVNDSLGIISNAHIVFADKEENMALSQNCIELARLFSIAVDFPKTGVPAVIPRHLRVKEYPDFMAKPEKNTYESKRIIGKLFREVKDISPDTASFRPFTKEVSRRSYDADMEVDGFRDYIDQAFEYKTQYDYKLGNLMDYFGIKHEAKILSGSIMKNSKTFGRRNDAEAIGVAVRSLRDEARSWFKKGRESDDVYAKASAWYHVTYHPDFWGCYNKGLKRYHYISFPWCVYDKLVHIKKKKNSSRMAAGVSSLNNINKKKNSSRKAAGASSLNRQFRQGLML